MDLQHFFMLVFVAGFFGFLFWMVSKADNRRQESLEEYYARKKRENADLLSDCDQGNDSYCRELTSQLTAEVDGNIYIGNTVEDIARQINTSDEWIARFDDIGLWVRNTKFDTKWEDVPVHYAD